MSCPETRKDKLSSRCLPSWAIRLVDTARHLAKMTAIANRYPLADRTNSLSCKPLFIISSGRSGTTLLRSMLVVGGQIAIPPESIVIPIAIRRFLSLQHLGWSDLSRLIVALFESGPNFSLWDVKMHPVYRTVIDLPEEECCLARITDEVFKCYAEQQFPEARLWGDKSPANTLYLPWIFRTFPYGKYLHLLRDGRDAIASMVARGRSTEYATERWMISVQQALELDNRLNSDQFLRVCYEGLVSQPVETLKKISSFIGVRYKAEMLDFWRLPTTIEHRHYEHHGNLGSPLFTDSIGRWTERLSSAQQQYVLSKTGSLLERFGYLK